MNKFELTTRIKELFDKGENIIQYLRNIDNRDYNTIEDILISYDFQAGSYIKGFYKNEEFKKTYANAIANVINGLGNYKSIIEVGVGEATTLANVLLYLNENPELVYGFDISWSRIKFAQDFLKDYQARAAKLFTANLFEIPLLDNSIDIVYTSHSLEPNGGREKEALQELYRIAGKYVVLLEPSYELGTEEARQRMEHHGYVKNLSQVAKDLGYKIVEHRLFDHAVNPLNPTGLIVIEKKAADISTPKELVCPITKTKLMVYNENLLFSPESLLAYPVIDGIPCLLKENAILATHLLTDYKDFKTANNITSAQDIIL